MRRWPIALMSLMLCVVTVALWMAPIAKNTSASEDPLVVMLDPGHGGNDVGTHRGDAIESIINEKLVAACRKELATYDNVLVYATRVGDNYIANWNRQTYAQEVGADLFVSFHINAYPADTSVNGAEVYVPYGNWKPELAKEAKALANTILTKLSSVELTGYGLKNDRLRNRGIRTRLVQDDQWLFYPDGSASDYYEVIRTGVRYDIPSMIIEHAYIDNEADRKMLCDDKALEKLGQATAKAIAEQYQLKKTGKTCQQPNLTMQTAAVYMGQMPSRCTVGSSPISLTASGGSGTGAYVFNSSNPKVIRIEGNQAYVVGAGDSTISVTRSGDATYAPRSIELETFVKVKVTGVTGQLTLKVTDNFRTEDGKQNVVLQCTPSVDGGDAVPTGTVTFSKNGVQLGTAQFDQNGVCTYTAKGLETGEYAFTAAYAQGTFDGFTLSNSGAVVYQVIATEATPTPVATPTPEDTVTGTPDAVTPTVTPVPNQADEGGFMSLLLNKTSLIILGIVVALILVAVLVLMIGKMKKY